MFIKFKKVLSGCLLTQMFFSGVGSISGECFFGGSLANPSYKNKENINEDSEEKEILESISKDAATDGDTKYTLRWFLNYVPFCEPYIYSKPELLKKIGPANYIRYIQEIFPGEFYAYNRDCEIYRINNLVQEESYLQTAADITEKFREEMVNAKGDTEREEKARKKYNMKMTALGSVDWGARILNYVFLRAKNPNASKNFAALGLAAFLSYSSGVIASVAKFFKTVGRNVRSYLERIFTPALSFRNYDKRLKALENRLKSKVIGQDEAIKSIIKRLRAHFANVALSKETGVPYNNGLVLYFVGPSGVGKTLVMDEIKKFFDLDTITMNMPLAVEDKGNNAVSVISRFLKPTLDDKKREIPTKISTLLSYGYPTLLNIDEVDKVRFLDYSLQKMEKLNSEGRLVGSSIDEAARQFMDTSNFAGYELKNSVLIMTSNETREGLFNSLEQSLVDRYKDCIVSFEYFDSSACEKFLVKGLEENLVAFYRKLGVDLVWDECSLKQVAKSLADKKASGRTIKVFLRDLVDTVGTFYKSKNTQDHKLSKMVLCYSEKDGVYVKGE